MLPEDLFSPDGEVVFAASVATGLENVAASEIAEKVLQKPAKNSVITQQGRVYFRSTKDSLAAIHSLRSIDRLYVVVKTFENYEYKETKEESLGDLRKLAHNIQWGEIIKFWFYNKPYCKAKFKQEDLGRKKTVIKTIENSKNDSIESQDELTSVNKSDLTISRDNDSDKSPSSPKRLKSDNCELAHSPVQGLDSVDELNLSDDVTKPVDDNGATIPTIAPDGTLIRFRVSSNRVGKKQPITSPEASYKFGGEIQDLTKWKVDLTNYNLEIMLCLGLSSLEVTVALTLQSLHRRNITHFGMTTLRATTAYSMLRLCDIQPGDIVIDPMCGSGAIPVEGCLEWPDSFHIGGDNTKAAVTRCHNNIKHIDENPGFVAKYTDGDLARQRNGPTDVIRWDVTDLPMKTSCADVIVSDLPFGKRVGSKTDNRKLYPALLKELARVTRPETGRACLLTQDKRTIIRALDALSQLWKIKKTLYINIGGLTAGIFLLKRTKNPFQS